MTSFLCDRYGNNATLVTKSQAGQFSRRHLPMSLSILEGINNHIRKQSARDEYVP